MLGSLLVAGGLACSSGPGPAPTPATDPDPDPGPRAEELLPAESGPLPRPRVFSGVLAESHETALRAFGARWPGSASDELARAYLAREFLASGARVWEVRDRELRHLIAEIEGDSSDQILLVAPFPVIDPDDWIGDSGAALFIELARVLGLERPPYTIRFALAETRASDGPAGGALPEQLETPAGARARVVAAGESLARALADAELESKAVLRGVVAFDAPARPDLQFARDIRSHPIYRDVFWTAASRLGFEVLFPPDAPWSSPRSLHLGFEAAADGKVLALVDESWTRPERVVVPSEVRSTKVLEQSGRVTLGALEQLMHRFERIDGFGEARPPIGVPEASPPQTSPGFAEDPPSS